MTKKPWTAHADEIFQTAMTGLMFAVPAAWIAFGIHKIGWVFTPFIALPPICAFFAGRWTALGTWMKEFEIRAQTLERKIKDPTSALACANAIIGEQADEMKRLQDRIDELERVPS